MAKKETPQYMKHYDVYKKHADAVEIFSDNLQLKFVEATTNTLLKRKDAAWIKDGKYDRDAIRKGGKIIDQLADATLEELIKAASPAFKEMYKMEMPKLGDDPASKDFYDRFLGINKQEIKEFIEENKDNYAPETAQKLTKQYEAKWTNNLKAQTYTHIKPEEHLEDFLKHADIYKHFDESMLPALKKSQREAPIILQHILESMRNDKEIDYTSLQEISNTYAEQKIANIGQYLK